MAHDETTSTSGPRPGGTTTRVRVRDADGLVAAVPYLLGHHPRRSLVVVGVRDGAVQFAGRVDLLPGAPREVVAATWGHLVDVLRRNGCGRALVSLWSDVDPVEIDPRHVDDLVAVVTAGTSDGAGPRLVDLVCVGPRRFRSLLCDDDACCPVEGRPTAPLEHHPVAASFVLQGRVPAADRDAVEPPVAPAGRAERAVARRALRQAATGPRAREAQRTGRWRGRVPLLEQWLGTLPDPPSPALTGRLAAAWRCDVHLRDACLTALSPAGPDGARVLLSGRGADRVLDAATGGEVAGTLDTAGTVLRSMASLLDGAERAVVLAGHAWLSWAAGDGTRAVVLAERALADDPSQRLARLVLQCLQHGLGPSGPVYQAFDDPLLGSTAARAGGADTLAGRAPED